jgi:hypothetical protein
VIASQSPPEDAVAGDEFPAGIVCRACGKSDWRITRTRKCFGRIRRWRACLTPGCGHQVRTAELVEADAHPEHDAA